MRPFYVALIVALLICGMGGAEAIVFGGRVFTIEVTKAKDSSLVFDVVNLKRLTTAEETAKWCFALHEENRDKALQYRYSNSVRFRFSGGFTRKEIQLICDTFEMQKVYIANATMEADGKKVPFEYKPDLVNTLRLMGVSEEEVKKLLEEAEKATQEERKTQPAQQVEAPDAE